MPHVVHVGFHRAASTWLQKHVFPTVEGMTYASGPLVYYLLQDIVEPDHHPETLRAFITETGDRVLLSFEALVGNPWGSGVDADTRAKRLAEVAPSATIIIVKRDVDELRRSLYAQWVNEGGPGNRTVFERTVLNEDYLDLDKSISRFEAAFPKVHVLSYATLISDPGLFVDRLSEAVGARLHISSDAYRRNPSLTGWRLAAMRGWNRAFRRTVFNPKPWLPIPGAAVVRQILQTGQGR